jgi:nicotinamide-nucleotide amidase
MSALRLVELCRAKGLTLATAESCTGGMIAAAITDIPGASAVFTHGFVTYSNAAKTQMLGVPSALITAEGAVSEAVARRMALGAGERAGADMAIAVTGIAGPQGGTTLKPVGTVWFGLKARDGEVYATRRVFAGGRAAVRALSVAFALELLLREGEKP